VKTATVQIGNSDDKLPQATWARFVEETHAAIQGRAAGIHFAGAAASNAPWQNFAWVFEVEEGEIPSLTADLKKLRMAYGQDSVAWLEGETVFI
jgi:hypothetical protein